MPDLVANDLIAIADAINDRLRTDSVSVSALNEADAKVLQRRFLERVIPDATSMKSLRHVLLTGRRGAGKTSAMVRALVDLWLENSVCVWADGQVLRRTTAESAASQVMVAVLDELIRGLSPRRKFDDLRASLRSLRADYQDVVRSGATQQVEKTSNLSSDFSRGRSAGAAVSFEVPVAAVSLDAKMDGTRSSQGKVEESTTLSYELDVSDRMDVLTGAFRVVMDQYRSTIGSEPVFVFLDDFYYVTTTQQAHVVDCLQRHFKNLNIWMKIGSVRHRTRLHIDGDPPIGLESPHDVTVVSLDVSLEQFESSRKFLEKILSGVCEPFDLQVQDLVADVARTRLVLASGGVPRDYLYLVTTALSRQVREGEVARISAETVNDVAPELLEQKWRDLKRDVAESDRDRVVRRLNSVHNFCIKDRKANVFLMSSEDVLNTEAGQDVAALAELRLLHNIGSTTVKTSDKQYVGIRYSAFCLDLAAYANTRVRSVKQIEFWTADGKQAIRAKSFVYDPELLDTAGEGEHLVPAFDQLALWGDS
jgi:hypothetical protein